MLEKKLVILFLLYIYVCMLWKIKVFSHENMSHTLQFENPAHLKHLA